MSLPLYPVIVSRVVVMSLRINPRARERKRERERERERTHQFYYLNASHVSNERLEARNPISFFIGASEIEGTAMFTFSRRRIAPAIDISIHG